ncbi:hypothetical protein [Chitinophaga sp. RAB17]|uniref:hypothetical protein n=1 Tax=Chitinophaga sp. RAB17 TaxID=3233049 RepID=UPI003F8E3263
MRDRVFLKWAKDGLFRGIYRLCSPDGGLWQYYSVAGATGEEWRAWAILLLVVRLMLMMTARRLTRCTHEVIFLAIARDAGKYHYIQ